MNICCISKYVKGNLSGYIYELNCENEENNFVYRWWGFSYTLLEVLKETHKLERICKRNLTIITNGDKPLDEKGLDFCFKNIERLRKKDLVKRLH